MNCSQISTEISLSLVIISHGGWDSGEGRRVEKDRGSQESIIGPDRSN